MNRKKGLSVAAGRKIARALQLDEEESAYFCALIEREHSRSPKLRAAAQQRIEGYERKKWHKRVAADQFQLIADWYHFALLELIQLPQYRGETEWLSRMLHLPKPLIEEGLMRLERLGLVVEAGERYKATGLRNFGPDGIPLMAVRRFHSQILEKAAEALVHQPVEERDFFTLILPTSGTDLERARDKIRALSEEFSRDLGDRSTADRVSCLSIQFFPLTPSAASQENLA